jgi:SAM-dependent methyltransferase
MEIGCASGAMLLDLTELGFRAIGVETSEKAYDISTRILREYGDVAVYRSIPENKEEKYDYIMAMEVLEHIDDDMGALIQWNGLLREGGRLLLSVPAKKRKWSSSDVWAGHYRRYERSDLIKLMREAGFEQEDIVSYGFPFKNMVDIIRSGYHRWLINKMSGTKDTVNRRTATADSGINRKLEVSLFPVYHNPLSSYFMRIVFWIQSLFYRTELGNGYIVVARKKERSGRETIHP